MDIQVLGSSSKGNCYRVSDGITPLLLEAGLPFKEIQRKLNFQMSKIAGCLITHGHQDHCKSTRDILKAAIECYMSSGTWSELGGVSGSRVHIVTALQQFWIGSWTVLPFDVQHDAAEPLGFLMVSSTGEKLLFATDTYYIKYKFTGLTHIMIECNHSYEILNANVESGALPVEHKNRLIRSHFSLENVTKFLLANDLSKVKEIWLLHLSDGNSDADLFKKTIQEASGKPVYIA